MWAPHWRGPFTLVTEPIALPSALHCPTGNLAEDPYLWHDGASHPRGRTLQAPQALLPRMPFAAPLLVN